MRIVLVETFFETKSLEESHNDSTSEEENRNLRECKEGIAGFDGRLD